MYTLIRVTYAVPILNSCNKQIGLVQVIVFKQQISCLVWQWLNTVYLKIYGVLYFSVLRNFGKITNPR